MLNTSDPVYREAKAQIEKYVADQVRPLQRKIAELEQKVAKLESDIASIGRPDSTA